MTLSIWRYAHLVLAILASLILVMASLTGIVLAVDTAREQTKPYEVSNFDDISINQIIPELRKIYPEIANISVDHNHFVAIDAFDDEGNEIKGYINPNTGKVLGKLIEKNKFITWNLALHRSLFLHETGRFIVGFASFLFFLIAVSGTILLIKRQNGIKNFFSKVHSDSLSQYFHVVSGRVMLIPILIIALTATYLFLNRFEIIPIEKAKQFSYTANPKLAKQSLNDFAIFEEIKLSEVSKIEFPFMDDDPEEFFILKLQNRELTVNQFTVR